MLIQKSNAFLNVHGVWDSVIIVGILNFCENDKLKPCQEPRPSTVSETKDEPNAKQLLHMLTLCRQKVNLPYFHP